MDDPGPDHAPTLWRRHRWRMALTYALTLTENLCDVLYPALTGYAVDGLLGAQRWRLLPLLALWTGHLLIGSLRHLYDTGVFTRIHAELAGGLIARQRAAGVGADQIAARVGLSREMVAFLETDVPATLRALFRLVGAVLMLCLYDRAIGLMALAALLPIGAITLWFGARSARLNAALNDRLEREVGIVSGHAGPLVRRHFARVRFWRIRISRAEAAAWGGVELAVIGLTLAVLWRATSLPSVTAGEIYAVLAYVWSFYDGVGDIPGLVQRLARVRDILARVGGPERG